MEAVTKRGLAIFREAWINIMDLSPSVEWIDDGPKITRMTTSGPQLLSIEIEIRIQEVLGTLMIGLPPEFLLPIADRLNQPSVADLWKDPGKGLTNSQMTGIRSIHEKFAGSLAEFLSEWAKTPVKASLISVEQFSFEEFFRSIQRPGFLAGFKSDSLEGKALIAIDLEVAFSFPWPPSIRSQENSTFEIQ